jgi:hypothetical protein
MQFGRSPLTLLCYENLKATKIHCRLLTSEHSFLFFMSYLTIRSQNHYYTALGGMIYELERIWKETVWLNQGTIPAMKKTMKNLSQDSRHPE